MSSPTTDRKPGLLILASTYPRWRDDPEPGFVHELARRLVDQFHVVVLCPHATGAARHELLDGVHVQRYRYAPQRWETLVNDGGIVANLRRHKWRLLLVPGFVLAQAWWAWRLLRSRQFALVHAHWLIPQGLIAALLCRHPVRFVVTSHGADLYALRGRLLDRLKRWVVARAAATTVVSAPMRERLIGLGAEASRISVQPMGVDFAGRFVPDRSVVRSSLELLFVGRLVEKKGLRHLLDALPAVLAEHPQVVLTVAGFGPEESALRTQARCLGIDGQVHFLGAVLQSELPRLYQRATVFVAPFVRAASGDEEGLGLVVVEAIACECPVVVSDLPATRDLLEDRVPAGDSAALAARLIALLRCPPAQRQADAMTLRQRVMGRLDWQAVAQTYTALLSKVAEERGVPE